MRARVLWVGWLLLFVLSACWSMSTPIAGAPDEPAHLVKAASVVRGDLVAQYGEVVRVPRYVLRDDVCFAFRPNASASCSGGIQVASSTIIDATTSAGLYNPVYYYLVGWPTLLWSDEGGIYAMRLVNAAICSFFLAAAFAMVSTWRRPGIPLLGLTVAVTPMVIYLDGVINPNSLEIVATLSAFVGMLSIIAHPRDDHLALRAGVVLLAGALAVNMRGLSPLWLAIALFAPFLLLSKGQLPRLLRTTAIRVAIGGVAIGSAFALFWLWRSNSLGSAIETPGVGIEAPGIGASPASGFLSTLEQTFGLARNMIGVFGWLDTPAPEAVFFIWSAFTGVLVVLSAVLLRGRPLLLALLLTVAVLILPPVIQAAYITGGGFIWQGRYTLPAFVCLLVGLATLLGDRLGDLDRGVMLRTALLVVVPSFVAHVWSLLTNLRRNSVGADAVWSDLLFRAEWQPPGGVVIWAALFTAALAAAALLIQRAIAAGSTIENDVTEEALPQREAEALRRAR